MARYIDADLLKKTTIYIDDLGQLPFDVYMVEDIENAPTADVVPVVRCKECKYRKGAFHTDRRRKEGGYWLYWCELDTGDPFELGRNAEDDDWFCADGERREE